MMYLCHTVGGREDRLPDDAQACPYGHGVPQTIAEVRCKLRRAERAAGVAERATAPEAVCTYTESTGRLSGVWYAAGRRAT
jgi:hypothetical protein